MIPNIGLMIGAYIVVRMASFVCRKGANEEPLLIRILSILNIVFVIFLMAELLTSGMSMADKFPRIP